MKNYRDFTLNEAKALYSELSESYEKYKVSGIKLDISRGKPNADQLDIANGVLTGTLTKEECISESGVDYRNYGLLDGIPEAKRLFADLLGLEYDNIIVAS